MRWIEPVAWLRGHPEGYGEHPETLVAAVLFALQHETGARWLFAPRGHTEWIAVRNVCAASYRGEGLRARLIVGAEVVDDARVPMHLCGWGVRPAGVRGARVSSWAVEAHGTGLVVRRADPPLCLRVDAALLGNGQPVVGACGG